MENTSVAFTVWAAVVALIGGAIWLELKRLRAELSTMTVKLNDYILVMERRVTHIEAHLQYHDGKFFPIHREQK